MILFGVVSAGRRLKSVIKFLKKPGSFERGLKISAMSFGPRPADYFRRPGSSGYWIPSVSLIFGMTYSTGLFRSTTIEAVQSVPLKIPMGGP